jgi:hypothetical protein
MAPVLHAPIADVGVADVIGSHACTGEELHSVIRVAVRATNRDL